MTYLYGDSSEFPLDTNFIETLRDLIKSSVVILRAQEKMALARRLSESIGDTETDELDLLSRMSESINSTLEPYMLGSFGGDIAGHIVRQTKAVLDAASGETSQRAEAGREEVRTNVARCRTDVRGALEEFFVRHSLPKTEWRYLWRTHPTEVRAHATSETGVGVVMEVDIPESHRLNKSIRASELQKGVSFSVPSEGGWLRRNTIKRKNLDGLYLVGIDVSSERTKIALRKSGKSPSPGFEVVVGTSPEQGANVLAVDENGKATDDRLNLAGEDVAVVRRFASAARAQLGEIENRRVKIVRAQLDGDDVDHLDRPGVIAERLINTVAPLVREMRRRGSSRGELVLKRDTGDGRREELYVPRQELVRGINTLSAEHRVLFSPFALAEPTQVFGDTAVDGKALEGFDFHEKTKVEPPPPPAGATLPDLKVVK